MQYNLSDKFELETMSQFDHFPNLGQREYYPEALYYQSTQGKEEENGFYFSEETSCSETRYWDLDRGMNMQTPVFRSTQKPVLRVVKKNRKERKRTVSINNAFAELRDVIPNVPPDTKLSKIKTLRLASSYICYLMRILKSDDPSVYTAQDFKVDLGSAELRKSHKINVSNEQKRSKGRTGWPQHVWALELQQDAV